MLLSSEKIFAEARNQLVNDIKKDFKGIKKYINRIEMVAYNYFVKNIFNLHKGDTDPLTHEKMVNEVKMIILRCIQLDSNLT